MNTAQPQPCADPAPLGYCRKCGYDLRASANQCPECGQPFNPAKPSSFLKKPPSPIRRWLLRITCFLLTLSLAWGALVAWLWWGWKTEETLVDQLTHNRKAEFLARPSVYPLCAKLLPKKLEYLTHRVANCKNRSKQYYTAKDRIYSIRKFTDADLAHFANFSHLQTLQLDSSQITDNGLKPLSGLTRLKSLTIIASPKITNASLDNLKDMKQLQFLMISVSQIDDEGLKKLQALPQLQELYLNRSKVTGTGLVHLAKLKHLTKLHIQTSPISDDALANLSLLPQLKMLDLYGSPISDPALVHIAQLKNLEELVLQSDLITDAGVDPLAELTQLRSLNLHGPCITDTGLKKLRLAKKKNLQCLILSYTSISDDSLDELSPLKQLTWLEFLNTLISDDACKKLKAAMPTTRIEGNR